MRSGDDRGRHTLLRREVGDSRSGNNTGVCDIDALARKPSRERSLQKWARAARVTPNYEAPVGGARPAC